MAVPPRGSVPYPRYFSVPFSIRRVPVPPRLKPESADKQKLRTRARSLRDDGASYPEIAALLGISLGATWNLLNKLIAEPCGEGLGNRHWDIIKNKVCGVIKG